MEEFFNVKTLCAISAIMNFIIFLTIFYIQKSNKTYPGVSQWVFASFSIFSGFFLLLFRGILPDLITIVIADTLILMAYCLVLCGLYDFIDRKSPKLQMRLMILCFIGLISYFTYVDPNVKKRIILFTLFGLVYIIHSLKIVWVDVKKAYEKLNLILVVTFSLQVLVALGRLLFAVKYEKSVENFMAPSVIQGLTIITVAVGSISTYIGLIILYSQRISLELKKSFEEVKTLRGIFHICMYCKKIKNSEEKWENLDSYVRKKTDADFSHGLCPTCYHLQMEQFQLNKEKS